jgi:hypothetical protein
MISGAIFTISLSLQHMRFTRGKKRGCIPSKNASQYQNYIGYTCGLEFHQISCCLRPLRAGTTLSCLTIIPHDMISLITAHAFYARQKSESMFQDSEIVTTPLGWGYRRTGSSPRTSPSSPRSRCCSGTRRLRWSQLRWT